MTTIDMDMPGHRAKVMFRDQSAYVLSPEKLAGDVKNFREIAGMIKALDGERAKACAKWLETLSDAYSQ